MSSSPLRIGLSARLLHPDAGRTYLPTKSLQYIEQCVIHWIMSAEVLAFMIPAISRETPHTPRNICIQDYVSHLDGLVLQGGADIAPESYGDTPLCEEWAGDRIRDVYELELIRTFIAQGKPVLGICRGMQLINVAFGGTLYQDIATLLPESGKHRCEKTYENHFHDVKFIPETQLARLFPTQSGGRINTIHHQAVKTVGAGLTVEAVSEPDHIVEAVRWNGPSYVLGIQWHPEFMDPNHEHLLNCSPILQEFLDRAYTARNQCAVT